MLTSVSHENNFNLIRLLAALQVAVVHAINHFGFDFPGFELLKLIPGVPTFFFISGYLIYQSYDRTRHRGLGSFAINRVLRIYPALIVCTAVALAAVWLTGYFRSHPVSTGHFMAWVGSQITFFQFYNPDFMREFGTGVLNGALWTVSVELQFYVLIPILFSLLNRFPVIAALLFMVSLAVNLYVRQFLEWELLWMKLLYVSFLPWLYMFMLGACLASFPSWRERFLRPNGVLLFAAFCLTMLLVGSYRMNASNGINPISFVILAAMILKLSQARLPLPVSMTAFIRKEDFSYGLYLYHMPTINVLLALGFVASVANVFITLLVSFAAALLSWFLIERPALRHKRYASPAQVRPGRESLP